MRHPVPDSFGSELQEFNDCHNPAGPGGGQFCSGEGRANEEPGLKLSWGTPLKRDDAGRMGDLRKQVTPGVLVIGQRYDPEKQLNIIEFGRVTKVYKGKLVIERPDGTTTFVNDKVAAYVRPEEQGTAEAVFAQNRSHRASEEPGLRNRAGSGEEWLKFRLVHAATRFDRRAAGRPGHNRYALPQYFEAIDAVMQRVKGGESVVSALDQEFTPGPLLRALKKVILPPIKDVKDERGGPPVNWEKGFQWPLQIGAGGKETPFLRDGTWKLRVWDGKRKKHYIYDYRTDMLEDDR